MSVETIQHLVDKLQQGRCKSDEVRSLAQHPAAVVRVNAMEALGRLAVSEDSLVDELGRAALDPGNTIRLLGTTTVAHVAVGSLLGAGTEAAERKAHELIDAWPESDKQDLLWYLHSEGLLVGAASTRNAH